MNRTLRLLFVCLLQAVWAVASAYNLKVEATPHGACSLNTSGGDYDEGSRVYLRTYGNTGYVFKGWYKGDEVISSSASFYYTMPAEDVVLQARYEYDPSVPADPAMPDTTKRYKLSLGITPNGAGSLNTSGGTYAEGANVSLRAYVNTGYHFTGWTDEEGNTLSTSTSYSYTMPGRNVHLTANYYYDPSVPANPDSMATKYTVQVKCKPVGGGSFNTSSTTASEGSSVRLYSYTNTGYIFKHWEDSEGKVLSTAQNFYYTIPHGNSVVYGVFEYDPPVPSNPGKNYWNKELGEVIVDDFLAGSLGNAVSTVIGNSSRDDVAMITVAGKMNDNDFGIANNYTNCTLLDLSRVTGITTVPSYAFDYTNLESVYLPASVETIGYRAFYECKQLSSLTVYAMVPPAVENYAFSGIPEGLVVYVPASSISQYQEAEGWKNFTFLPIQEDIRNVTISLPEGTDASVYAQMWLELTNRKSGQRMHFVMTDRSSYTFANIIRNTSWNAVIRNQRGDVFGKIDAIDVADEDVTVAFESLQQPQNVTLTVKDAEGKDVTADTQITWTDAAGNYLAQSYSVNGLLPGNKLGYNIVLSQNLAMAYAAPSLTEYTVAESDNNIVCTLSPLQKVVVSGKVIDLTTKSAISGAVVSASQTFGGKYSKTTNVKTDNKGQYSIEVFRVPTSLAIAASDYVSQTIECDVIDAEGENVSVADVSLKSITGAVISLGFTYTKCPDNEGEEGVVESFYSDYNNVDYAIFNKTQNRRISQFNVQYPNIVLLEEVSENDVLELTASSRTSAFVPVKATAMIDAEQRASATFDIVGLGKLKSSFAENGNASVVGSLYDAKGKLIKTYDYSGGKLIVSDLADGNYTLVTMGSSRLFNTIYDLSQLPQTGLTKDVDYVQNNVKVESGKLSVISIAEVPTLDESKLYYTGDNTSFTVNKSSIVAGNYLTLTGHLDFKSAYSTKVSNVNLIVDLPESCSFVENSVMVGNSTSSYTLEGNRVIIPMARYTDRVRFCIIPTLGGDYAPSALAQFDIEGETITQPIGSANYTAKDLSISVPSTVAKTTIPVSGTAIGASDIEIYDGETLVGQTKSLANGLWNAKVQLNEAYNLSSHNIYAKVTTKKGIVLLSETKQVFYDKTCIEPLKVTMINVAHPSTSLNLCEYVTVFDFSDTGKPIPAYWYWPSYPDFTFRIDFTDNNPELIDNVKLHVLLSDNSVKTLIPVFDENKGCWVVSEKFYSNALPTNVNVSYDMDTTPLMDSQEMEDAYDNFVDIFQDGIDERNGLLQQWNSEPVLPSEDKWKEIDDLLSQDNYSIDDLGELLSQVINNNSGDVYENLDSLLLEVDKRLASIESQEEDYYSVYDEVLKLHLPNYDSFTEVSEEYEYSYETLGGITNISCKKIVNIDEQELLEKGYEKYSYTDGNFLYTYCDNEKRIFIDTRKNTVLTIVTTENPSQSNVYSNKAKASPGCIKELESTVHSLISLVSGLNENDDEHKLLHLIGNVSSALDGILGYIDCVYQGSLQKAYDVLQSAYEFQEASLKKDEASLIKDLDDVNASIVSKQDKISALEKQIVGYNNDISSLEKQLINASEGEKAVINQKIDLYKRFIESNNKEIANNRKLINKAIKQSEKIGKALASIKKKFVLLNDACIKTKAFLNKLPANPKVARGMKSITWTGRVAKVVGTTIGAALQLIPLAIDVYDFGVRIGEWAAFLYEVLAKKPCKNNPDGWKAIWFKSAVSAIGVCKTSAHLIEAQVGALILDATDIPYAWAASLALDLYSWGIGSLRDKYHDTSISIFRKELRALKCNDDDDDDDSDIDYPWWWPFQPVQHVMDPSGFVYEGVSSNRIEGVTATAYYKETVEDMYGDKHENIVKWDAAEYAQENPLFTDENGMYAWDVPNGLWQVKFEKEGYETTYSEWLPVPPPQLDINIAMKQNVQPTVKSARAFEDAVEMEFDKYMMPEQLTTDNIRVMVGETAVEGTVELLNEEVSYEGNDEKFASKVRFNAAAPFDVTEITLMVSNRVKSYAGIRMQDDFSQTFTIEPEVREIVCESDASVVYGNSGELTVQVLPAVASAGKTVKVKSSSSMILSTDVEELTLDSEGKASLTVNGELPGAAAITYSVDGYDLSATTMVSVEREQLIPDSPVASVASGSALLKGSSVTLSCPTSSAVIYYTTDGSCPCDAGAMKYDGTPITISEATTLKIMAVGKNGDESQVVTYTYTLRQTNLNIPLVKGWNWVSHNLDDALTSDKLEIDNVDRVLTQIGEIYRDPKLGFTGNIEDVNATDAFKVHTTGAGNLQLGGVMFNPYFSPVELRQGWNWLGYPLDKEITVEDAFSFMESEKDDVITSLEDGYSQYDGEQWIGTLNTLIPGRGYMFKSVSDKELPYNIFAAAALSANAASEIPSDDMSWKHDTHAYPNVMCVTADLYNKDVKVGAGEYLVGAFVDGECRGVGRYVGNTLFLSVHGDKNVEVTLLAMNTESGVVYDITEKIVFTQDVVGSVSMPYPLHLGSPTGISHITMDNSGFKSIHNMLGQKVKSIDRGGVYIINGKKVVVTKKNENDYSK